MTRSGTALATSVAICLLTGCATTPSSPDATDADLAITNVSVIDIERARAVGGQVVLIKGNRIVAVKSSRDVRLPGSVRVIDGARKFIVPGLWDMHAHLSMAGNTEKTEWPAFVAHGVTGIRVMGADRPNATPTLTRGLDLHRQWQAQIEKGTATGPRILALGSWPVDGPAAISEAMPLFYRARTLEEGQQLARYFKERGFDFIKIYNNLPRDGYLGLASEARRLGLPLAGHEPTSLSAIELSNAGQKSIEHSRIFLFNCFAAADSMRNRPSPGSGTTAGTTSGTNSGINAGTMRRRRMVDEYDPRICADVFRTFARNGTYITPTHVTRRMDALAGDSAFRNDPRLKYIPLPQRMAWLADANGMVAQDATPAGRRSFMDFYTKGLTLTNDAYRAGVPVMLGTDAGDSFVFPGSSVHDELGELIKAGLSPAEALRAATLSGAAFLGRTADFGTVQAGRFADLLVLDANPLDNIANTRRIHAVLLNGRVFNRTALDSMLASVEVAARPDKQVKLWAGATIGDTAMIAQALAEGARIDSMDLQRNRRALNFAAIGNHVPAVRLLIAKGAGLNLTNGTGFTPLHHAAEAGAADALTVLLAAGADVNIRSTQGSLPLETAQRRGIPAIVKLLEAAKKTP